MTSATPMEPKIHRARRLEVGDGELVVGMMPAGNSMNGERTGLVQSEDRGRQVDRTRGRAGEHAGLECAAIPEA